MFALKSHKLISVLRYVIYRSRTAGFERMKRSFVSGGIWSRMKYKLALLSCFLFLRVTTRTFYGELNAYFVANYVGNYQSGQQLTETIICGP